MKVAYIFSTSGHTASYKLGKMILPQLEQGNHGVGVVGMFFFDDTGPSFTSLGRPWSWCEWLHTAH